MTSAREDVFASIRRSLGVTGREAPRLAIVADRLATAPAGVIPERGQRDRGGRVALFKERAERVAATVTVVEAASAVPGEVARFLRDSNAPATVRIGADPKLRAMPWSDTALTVSEGASAGVDLNAVSYAVAGVAETGTLALVSGQDNPTTLNFLPDNHVVVVAAGEIEADYEGVVARLKTRFGPFAMPRTVNLITGPSRSADIEQTLILGAHGPRRLHIIVVEA